MPRMKTGNNKVVNNETCRFKKMKMMKKLTSCLLLAAGLMTWTGCASDDSVEEHPSTVGKTAFMMNETAKAGAKSRTAGTHTGTQLDFYWTAGDNLWLNDPLLSPI